MFFLQYWHTLAQLQRFPRPSGLPESGRDPALPGGVPTEPPKPGYLRLGLMAVFRIRIRIHRIHMFFGLLDPDPDLLVRGMDPDPDPYIMQK